MAFDPITAGLNLGKSILDIVSKVVPDAGKAQSITEEINQQVNQQVLGQMAINVEEAKSSRLFVAGWRPYLGWVCGAAFTWHFMVQPVLLFAVWFTHGMIGPVPLLDWSQLSVVLGGLLGLGAMRSFDKKTGTS